MRHLSFTLRFFFLASILSTAISVSGQTSSLSEAMNPDGTLKLNAAGTFDPSGYKLESGPNGEPRFVSATQVAAGACTPDNWDTTFTTNGADNHVRAVVADGAGNIYIGGSFSSVNSVPASRIAKWNGTSWSALGSGLGALRVHAIAVSGTDVYVGGFINTAGGMPALNIAKWNGTSWSALGAGIGNQNQSVDAIAVIGTDVYVGGSFRVTGGSFTDFIAKWDGAGWSTVGSGVNWAVTSLAVSGGNLFAAGGFTMAGGTSAFGIAKWDGVSWTSQGTASGTSISSIAASPTGDIYAGGTIVLTGQPTSQIAQLSGTTWTRLVGFGGGIVWAVAVVGSDVYVGGSHSGFNNIAKWNGTAWSALGGGLTEGTSIGEVVRGIGGSGNTLVVGGNFLRAGGLGARNVAMYSNGTWAGFSGTGLDSAATAIAVSGNDVYIGGSFRSAGPITANRIAKWNSATNTWSSLGGGISGSGTDNSTVSAIAVAGGKVYAGGSFPNIGGVVASNIAVWNGTTWAPLGSGITGGNGRVTAVVTRGDEIIVGGDFTTAGGVPATRIAKWNGTSWSAFPGNTVPNTVSGIAVSGSEIYVTSGTTTADNPNYLSRYDGSAWTGLAPGMGGHGLYSVVVVGSDVYVSGSFTTIGGIPAARVAKWNGSAWSALAGGLPQPMGQPGFVRLAVSGSNLIGVGDFTVAGGGPAEGAARWNGTAWTTLGNGLRGGGAGTVVSAGGDIFAGGSFTTAGCNASPFFARWRENVWTATTNTDWHTGTNWGSGSTPAANGGVTITSNDSSITSADVTLTSLIVTGGRTLTIGAGRTLTVNGMLDVNNGTIAGAGSLVVNDLSVTNNASITSSGSTTINQNLYLDGGIISSGPVSITSCRPGALSGGSSTSFVTSTLTRCVNPGATFRFPVGTGMVYAPVEVANATGTGNVSVDPESGPHAGATGLPANRLQRWWEITGSGVTAANITVSYPDTEVVGREIWYRVYRIAGSNATQLTTAINTTTNRMTVTGADPFASWTLAEGTSSLRTLAGRLTNPNGRGAFGALVSLTDDQGNVRYTVTNPFGYYRFMDVLTFRAYTVQVRSKKFTFTAPQRVVEFDEFTTSVNFVSADN